MQRLIAESFSVHPSTISRELRHGRELARLFRSCPTCGGRMPHEQRADFRSICVRLAARIRLAVW
jgi:IS30 family transposase